MVKLNARCFAILQNELPPKKKDPGSFILPCTIGTTTVSNALADLGASISIMPFSLFRRLGLRIPKPISMVIEMVDRSMQSPKGIAETVLVIINKFVFPVDFIILDIIEDDKVPIILGRPMLATAHARIDVFGKKISLEVRTKQITFDINERESLVVISHVCVINDFSKINEFDEPRNLEEFLMSDDINRDLGSFLNNYNILPDLESQDTMFLSPPGSARLNNSSGMFCNTNSNSSISLDDFVKMDNVWDNMDLKDLTNEAINSLVKPEFDSTCLVTIKPVPVSQDEIPLSLELVLCSGRPPDTAYPPFGYDVSNLLPRQRIDCCSLNNPYFDAQEGDGIYNFEESNEYSPQKLVLTKYDVSNPDELCKSEEFRVIRYSIGSDEEFITISPSKCDAWGKP
ncbi:homeodomain-like protein [Tanacetum coccineum]